jgi:hypothetical protein
MAAMNAGIKRGERLSQEEVLHLARLQVPAVLDGENGSVF